MASARKRWRAQGHRRDCGQPLIEDGRVAEETDGVWVACDMDVKDDLFEAAESGTASEVKAAPWPGAIEMR